MTRYRPPIGSTYRARSLRRRRTKAEETIWRLLRQSFPDAHFRFQVPIRDFVADFASHGAKLIIEVDGGQHGGTPDRQRTRIIESEGYRVLRFWNNEVLGNPEGVARMVDAALVSESTPHPNPPPSRGRELNGADLMARLNYVELPVTDIAAARSFYEAAFGWSLTAFGPTYAATTTGDTDIGLQGDAGDATQAPLAVIEVDDLEAALADVIAAGGTVIRPIFAFPGGRRFHFADPSGNELAAVKSDPHPTG